MSKPFKLTLKTYFDPKRPHLSVSMINDYIKSPEYYYKKHVLKEIERKPPTSAMKVGSYVDACLTYPQRAKRYEMKFERTCLAKEDRDTYDEESEIIELQKAKGEEDILSGVEWQKGKQLVEFIKSQSFWKAGLDTAIMQMVMELPHGIMLRESSTPLPLCGLPDRMDWSADKTLLHIQDLKCSSPAKAASPMRWLLNAQDMGYVRQFAMYRLLACKTFGITREQVVCSHVVALWYEDGLVDVKLFTFPNSLVDKAEKELMDAIEGIQAQRFPRKDVTWSNSVNLSTSADALAKYHAPMNDDESEDEI